MSIHEFVAAHGAATHPLFKTLESSASLKSIIYAEVNKRVEEELAAELEATGKSQKRGGNFRTAMKAWLREFGLMEESPVGREFGSDFTDSLERYLTSLSHEGKSAQTLADRRSMINAYREGWVSILQEATAGCWRASSARHSINS